jgi:hypothetical protein
MKNSFAPRLAAVALAAVGLFTLSSCSTAEVKDVWTAPGLTRFQFKKALVIVAAPGSKDGAGRRTAEDSIAQALPNMQAVPSYTFITEGDLQDAAKSAAAIKSSGFDGVILMRVVSVRQEVNAVPGLGYYGGWGYGPYWYGPYGYGRHGYGRYGYGPYGYGGWGYGGLGTTITTDQIISIEINIYEFPSEKLLWSGSVESTSPKNVKQMIDDAIGAILEHMAKQGLIPPREKK